MKRIASLVLAICVCLVPNFALGAIGSSTPQQVTVNLTVAESLTLTLGSGSITLPLNGTNSTPLTATVQYNLTSNVGHPQGIAYAYYFTSATAALTGPGNISPASISATLSGSDTGATTPCNQTAAGFIAGVPGAVCFSGSFGLPATSSTGTLNDSLVLKYTGSQTIINGSYSGALDVVYYAP